MAATTDIDQLTRANSPRFQKSISTFDPKPKRSEAEQAQIEASGKPDWAHYRALFGAGSLAGVISWVVCHLTSRRNPYCLLTVDFHAQPTYPIDVIKTNVEIELRDKKRTPIGRNVSWTMMKGLYGDGGMPRLWVGLRWTVVRAIVSLKMI